MMVLRSTVENNRIINYRPLFEIAIGFMLGIAVCGELSAYGKLGFILIIMLGIGAEIFILHSRRALLFMLAILLGCCLIQIYTPNRVKTGTYRVSGIVESVGREDAHGKRYLTVDRVIIAGRAYSRKAYIHVSAEISVSVGDSIEASVNIKELSDSNGYLGNKFDERKYYLSKGIGLYGDAKSFTLISNGGLPLRRSLNAIRTSFEYKAYELFGSDGETVIKLLMGSSEAMQSERRELYRDTGISHILSISGFHMAVIVSIVGRLLPRRRRWLRIGIIGFVMIIYCMICVRSPGIIRSAIMTFALLVSSGFERREDGLSAISLAAIAILISNPYQLYSISFQLSFAACFGILMIGPCLNRLLRRYSMPVKLGLSTSISASIATMVLQMHYFGTLSTYTLLSNMFAVPIFSLAIPFMLVITMIGYPFPELASILAYLPRSLLFLNDRF